MIPESQWKWFGMAGHFICAAYCRHHLCTQIGNYLVSTVGQYIPPSEVRGGVGADQWLRENWPGHDIGCNRKFETMVFAIEGYCHDPDCGCEQPLIVPSEVLSEGYSTIKEANEGHVAMCRRVANGEAELHGLIEGTLDDVGGTP